MVSLKNETFEKSAIFESHLADVYVIFCYCYFSLLPELSEWLHKNFGAFSNKKVIFDFQGNVNVLFRKTKISNKNQKTEQKIETF